MIIKFKIFEDIELKRKFRDSKPDFDIGDTVICVYDRLGTSKGKKYIVTNIFTDDDNGTRGITWYCTLDGLDNHLGKPIWYYCDDFISEVEYNSKKFNI